MPERTTGRFTFADWEEKTIGTTGTGGTGRRLARASVNNTFSGGVEAAGTACEFSIVYVSETTGTFTGMELLQGQLDGRKGAFAWEERGSFDADGTVHCTFEVVPGSGTEELTGLRGTGNYTAAQGETSVRYTFEYELDGAER